VKNYQVPFWEQPLSMWDEVNIVGLRNHYFCAVHAARMMVPRKSGLIVNISSVGGLSYLFNVAYGVGKEACDRMAVDCGLELKRNNVAFLSLWPGAVATELMVENSKTMKLDAGMKSVFSVEDGAETTEFAGKAVAFLSADPNVMQKSGHIILTADLADEFGFIDINGRKPSHMRSVSTLLKLRGFSISSFVPCWLKLPRWVFSLAGNKF
jgi:dehydrogenase/reductase SDR family protein 1